MPAAWRASATIQYARIRSSHRGGVPSVTVETVPGGTVATGLPWPLAGSLEKGQAGGTKGVFAFADFGRAPFLANGYAVAPAPPGGTG